MRPAIHLRQNSLMILMFFVDQVDLRNLLDLLDRQVNRAHHQDGLQIHHLLVIGKEWDLEMHRVSVYLCDLHHPSLNLFQFLYMMTMMFSHHKKRGDGDGLDRVRAYTLIRKFHRNHKLNLWLLQKLMIYQMRTFQI